MAPARLLALKALPVNVQAQSSRPRSLPHRLAPLERCLKAPPAFPLLEYRACLSLCMRRSRMRSLVCMQLQARCLRAHQHTMH